jgi:hypothetical protein
VLDEREVAACFGLETFAARSGRQGGHLFIVVDAVGILVARDRLRFAGQRQPAETAFAFARGERGLVSLGVARWMEAEGAWAVEAVDADTWGRWGAGAGAD